MRIFRVPSLICKLFPQIYWRDDLATEQVFLSFDDGPDPNFTPKILSLLEAENSQATFFVLGKKAQQYPSLISQIHQGGHAIGIHSYVHQRLLFQSHRLIQEQIINTKSIIEGIIHRSIHYLRPPYGTVSPFVTNLCQQLNLRIILWNMMSYDFDMNIPDHFILKLIRSEAIPGDIIVFHDGHANSGRTVRILPAVLTILKEKGFRVSAFSKL